MTNQTMNDNNALSALSQPALEVLAQALDVYLKQLICDPDVLVDSDKWHDSLTMYNMVKDIQVTGHNAPDPDSPEGAAFQTLYRELEHVCKLLAGKTGQFEPDYSALKDWYYAVTELGVDYARFL